MVPSSTITHSKEIFNRHLIQFVNRVHSLTRRCVSVAKDPVLLWDCSRTLTLAIPSYALLLPFYVVRNQEGLSLLAVRKNRWLRGLSYTFNAVIAARVVLLASICLNPKFQWNVDGKFTADAITLGIVVLSGLMALSSHLTLLYSAQDYAFLYNSVRKLNKAFSGNFYTHAKLTDLTWR